MTDTDLPATIVPARRLGYMNHQNKLVELLAFTPCIRSFREFSGLRAPDSDGERYAS